MEQNDEQSRIDNFLQYATIRRTLARADVLDAELMLDNIVYYVKSGAVKVCYQREGREMILEFGLTGDFITNLFSFITGKQSNLYIQALRKSELVGIPRPYFEHVASTDPDFARIYIGHLEKLALELLQKEVMLFMRAPEERIKMLMKIRPRLFQEIPMRHIAHYLDLAPETLSRVLSDKTRGR